MNISANFRILQSNKIVLLFIISLLFLRLMDIDFKIERFFSRAWISFSIWYVFFLFPRRNNHPVLKKINKIEIIFEFEQKSENIESLYLSIQIYRQMTAGMLIIEKIDIICAVIVIIVYYLIPACKQASINFFLICLIFFRNNKINVSSDSDIILYFLILYHMSCLLASLDLMANKCSLQTLAPDLIYCQFILLKNFM